MAPASPTPPDAECQKAMGDVWDVYARGHEELTTRLRERLSDHPEFGPLVRSTPPDPVEEARSRAVLAGAMQRGEWEGYWDSVREQATGYAHADISLAAWVEVIHLLRSEMLDRLFSEYGVNGDGPLQGVKALDRWLDDALAVFSQAFVDASAQVIARQQQAIRQLSTPVLQLHPGLLILPIVGVLDVGRLAQLRAAVLEGIRARRARLVVVDVTGVPEIDAVAAQELIATVSSARMMGAEVIVSGLSAAIAQTLVNAGIDLSSVE
ncbi:MAG: rsbT co-antagonist protein RsbR, partial [Thermoleophilaceae bacterium]|nr:rsbT co-antagonist protein RsbR [Thermoleophilaceae bacterium]